MSGLAHFLELEGIATTVVSLIREHSEIIRPPRSLWVPFPLGRPLGTPGNAGFQRRVVRAALALLERSTGPVIEDFPDDAPIDPTVPIADGLVCPVSFPTAARDADGLDEAMLREVAQLLPWYEISLRSRGRTTVGASGLTITEAAGLLGAMYAGKPVDARHRESIGTTLKHAIEDLKAFYQEAALVQPGGEARDQDINDWLWEDTALGRLFRVLSARLADHDDRVVRLVATRALVPRTRA